MTGGSGAEGWSERPYSRTGGLRETLRRPWSAFLESRRTYRTKLTLTGGVLIVLSVAVGLAAFNTAQNILYLGLSLMLGSLLLSGVVSGVNFAGCRWRVLAGRHGRVGQPLPLVIELWNEKRWVPSHGLVVELSLEGNSEGISLAQRARLGAGQKLLMKGEILPLRRGQQKLGVPAVSSRFPFGFLNKSIKQPHYRELIIWPPRAPYTMTRNDLGSGRRSGRNRLRRGDGSELVNLRAYRPGDPLRLVHWKATARRGQLLVREMAEASGPEYSVIVDTVDPAWTGQLLDRLAAVAGSLIEDLFRDGHLAAACINGRRIPIRRPSDLETVWSELALLEPSAGLAASTPGAPSAIRFQPRSGRVEILCGGEVVGEG